MISFHELMNELDNFCVQELANYNYKELQVVTRLIDNQYCLVIIDKHYKVLKVVEL